MNLPFKKTIEKLLPGDISWFLKTSTENKYILPAEPANLFMSIHSAPVIYFSIGLIIGNMLSGAVIPAVFKTVKNYLANFLHVDCSAPGKCTGLVIYFPVPTIHLKETLL